MKELPNIGDKVYFVGMRFRFDSSEIHDAENIYWAEITKGIIKKVTQREEAVHHKRIAKNTVDIQFSNRCGYENDVDLKTVHMAKEEAEKQIEELINKHIESVKAVEVSYRCDEEGK
jgi:hypothetical protein